MAFDYSGTANYHTKTIAALGVPVSHFAHFNPDALGAVDCVIDTETSADPSVNWCFMPMLGAGTVQAAIRGSTGGDTQSVTSTNAATAGAWNRATAVYTSTGQTIYLNGTKTAGGGTVSVPPTAMNNLHIGSKPSFSQHWDGKIAEAAVWNVALTDAEAAMLEAGYCPLLVRPASLIHYVGLVRSVQDRMDSGVFTETGTGTAGFAHPRVIYPRQRSIFVPSAAAGVFQPMVGHSHGMRLAGPGGLAA